MAPKFSGEEDNMAMRDISVFYGKALMDIESFIYCLRVLKCHVINSMLVPFCVDLGIRDLKFESRQYLLSEKLLVDVDIKFKKRSPSEEFKIKNISQESYMHYLVLSESYCTPHQSKYLKNTDISSGIEERDCAFCRKNGEQKQFYTTHSLKDQKGNVTCPVLQKYVCPSCGATGLTAHTKLYCPYEKHYISPVVSHLTPRMSSGKRRTKFQL
eukprot:XP_014786589.1 PREDICTED: uncharacterized protein LOC106880931 [Octopus bimaculoides]